METKTNLSTIEEKLKAMRSGYKAASTIKYGQFEIPVKILTADEENKIYAEARMNVSRMPEVSQDFKDAMMPLENMKAILCAATTMGATQYLPISLLNQLTSSELQAIYERYLDVCGEIDPEFMSLSQQEIVSIIEEVKKSPLATRDLSTRQVKGIGLYFLENLLPMVSKLGG
jgi:nucleoid-associated protein YejK